MANNRKKTVPSLSTQACALRRQVSQVITTNLRLHQRQKIDPLMPDERDAEAAQKVCAAIPLRLKEHLTSNREGTIVVVMEVRRGGIKDVYSGPLYGPGLLEFNFMRGTLRAVYMICQEAGLEPQATTGDGDLGPWLELTVNVAPLIKTVSSATGKSTIHWAQPFRL